MGVKWGYGAGEDTRVWCTAGRSGRIIDNRPKEDQQAARGLAEAVLKHLEGGKQMSLLPGVTLLQPAGM
jgi:hypothetical protein